MAAMDQAHALVVGIGAYQRLTPLPAVVTKDARDVHTLLVDPARGGHPPGNATLLLDGDATGAALRAALDELAARSTPDSSVVLYYSGHGGRLEGGPEAGEYLLPVDTDPSSAASVAATAVSGAEFSERLAAIPARKVLVVFDCCHAAGIGRPKDAAVAATAPALKAGLPEAYYDALRAGRGRAILASSRHTESSWVMPGLANSLFTTHLLEGLAGGAPSDDGLVRVFDLFEYVQPRVTGAQPAQHPVFKADLEENFPVALRLGGQKGLAATDPEGWRYDVYVSYVDVEPDATWVWETLVPRLEGAGLRVAVSGDVEEPGVARVVSVERGMRQARRTVIVVSPAFLADGMAHFETVLAQHLGIEERAYRLVPVVLAPVDRALRGGLAMLSDIDLTRPQRAEREMDKLVRALGQPLPTASDYRGDYVGGQS
jgi:hypothetical protein